MAIINATPDSFSSGGVMPSVGERLQQCERAVEEGADILDIGGESTRPGAVRPSLEEELERVLPVVRHAVTLGVPVSVDTSRPEVMQACLDQGADIINDVRALREGDALGVVARHPHAGVCLMHMQGEPGTMQAQPSYGDVVTEVRSFLRQRMELALAAGIARSRLVLDPGFGFGKGLDHNLTLAKRMPELRDLGVPLLVGWSRKSVLGRLTGRDVGDRGAASLGAALAAVASGASIVRVHDVAATVDALKAWQALVATA